MTGFPPHMLREYALIADGRRDAFTAALIVALLRGAEPAQAAASAATATVGHAGGRPSLSPDRLGMRRIQPDGRVPDRYA